MANEADSNHTTPLPRWGETAGEVPGVGVVEPSGGKKDTGWVPGVDVPVGEWWNWLHWAAGVSLRYFHNRAELVWPRPQVVSGADPGEGVVTNGVGWSVDVTSCRVLIGGAMYTVPAATNLAVTDSAIAQSRIDLVVARLDALIPEFLIVEGTPDTPGSQVAPSAPADTVPIAEILIPLLSGVPGAKTSRREFGALDADAVRSPQILKAGSMGAGISMLEVYGSDSGLYEDKVTIGPSDDPFLVADDTDMRVEPEVFRFKGPINRTYDLGPPDFQFGAIDVSDVDASGIDASNSVGYALIHRNAGSATAAAAVRLPHGVIITGWTVRGTQPDTPTLNASMYKVNKSTNVHTIIGTSDISGGIGDFSLSNSSLSETTDLNTYMYKMHLVFSSFDDSPRFWNASIVYTETHPFNGL